MFLNAIKIILGVDQYFETLQPVDTCAVLLPLSKHHLQAGG